MTKCSLRIVSVTCQFCTVAKVCCSFILFILIEIVYSIIAPWRLFFMSSFSEFERQVLPNTQIVEKM